MRALLTIALLSGLFTAANAATTINPVNKFAYGANFGWLDWRGDTNSGAVIGEYVCAGNIFAANVGWISLGGGAPTNGIQYLNLAASDYGVNHDGLGNLRGFAYGANIGWLNFENSGAAKVDLKTGKLSGSCWSANCGWISLSNAVAFVQTDTIASGEDSDLNGLPDAWERTYFGVIGLDPNADPDSDGMSNKQEYLAGTNPNDASDKLIVTTFSTTLGGTLANVTWKSAPTRCYNIQETLSLTAPLWFDSGLGLIAPDGATTTRLITDTNAPIRFYRVKAVKPLSP